MYRLIISVIMLGLCGLSACLSKTNNKESAKLNPIAVQPTVNPNKLEHHEYVVQMAFVAYLDDGDYFQLLAKKGDSTHNFINESDTSRNLIEEIRYKLHGKMEL